MKKPVFINNLYGEKEEGRAHRLRRAFGCTEWKMAFHLPFLTGLHYNVW